MSKSIVGSKVISMSFGIFNSTSLEKVVDFMIGQLDTHRIILECFLDCSDAGIPSKARWNERSQSDRTDDEQSRQHLSNCS